MSYDEISEPMKRMLWLQEFEVDYEEVLGQGWPLVIVTKWERNLLGERRFVGTRIYRHAEEPLAETTTAT
jgi:hypothetical protein